MTDDLRHAPTCQRPGVATERGYSITITRCLGCGAAIVDDYMCVGCGQCTTKCKFDAISLVKTFDGEGVSFEKIKPVVLKTMLKREVKIIAKKVSNSFSKKD